MPTLPTSRRNVLALALYFDPDRPQTPGVIARKFGISRRAVRNRIDRGIQDIRAAGLKIPPLPGCRAPKLAQASACGDLYS